MAYYNWTSIEELYAGTTLREKDLPQENNMALLHNEHPEDAISNRKQLMKELNFSLERCVFPHQTHSNIVHKVTKDDIGAGAFSNKDAIHADALYTREKNVLLGVFSADCVPILIYDRAQGIVAAIHAGWKGTVNELTKKVLEILLYEEDCVASELYAYIGPAIDFLSFEVEQDVVDQVRGMYLNADKFIIDKGNGKYLVDNKRLNHQMLLDIGIPDLHIFSSDKDTYEDSDDFFSHRKNKDTGRNMTFILQK